MDHQEGAKKDAPPSNNFEMFKHIKTKISTHNHDNDFWKLLGPPCMKQKPFPKAHKTSMCESSWNFLWKWLILKAHKTSTHNTKITLGSSWDLQA
jgi:hypothetical protein